MTGIFELGTDTSAASIVNRFGDAAPDKIAAEAVEMLETRNLEDYMRLKDILRDVENLLAERRAAKSNSTQN